MKVFAPFIDQAGRRRTLYRYYHVQPKPKKVPLTRGQSIAKQIGWYLCKVVFWTGTGDRIYCDGVRVQRPGVFLHRPLNPSSDGIPQG